MSNYVLQLYDTAGGLVFDSTQFRLSRVFGLHVFTAAGSIVITDDRFLTGTSFAHCITLGGQAFGFSWSVTGNQMTLTLSTYVSSNVAIAFGAF